MNLRILKTIGCYRQYHKTIGCYRQYHKIPRWPVSRFNWCDHGVVSEVQNQGPFNTCYAHTVVSTIEALYRIKRHEHYKLSRQELVDNFYDREYKGGSVIKSFKFIKDFGISHEKGYPYIGYKRTPKNRNREARRRIFISDYECVPPGNQFIVMDILSRQPIIASLRVPKSFNFHRGDNVYYGNEARGEKMYYHSVEIVGWDDDYFIVKNSYGKKWGDKGFLYLWRGRDRLRPLGACGVYGAMTYPILYDNEKDYRSK